MATWTETTEAKFNEMLGVLPPAAWGDGAFQVGEPMSHRNGRPTFSSFKEEGGKFFESDEALTFAEFKAEVKNATYLFDY